MPAVSKQRVAIIGLGLMGGSLGLALKQVRNAPVVHGYARRAETRRLALKMGAVDKVFATPAEAASQADVVVICTPVLSIAALTEECVPVLASGAILTDVGSTKQRLLSQMATLRVPFVGSHPMAGSEKSGLDAARADLYKGTVVILTPGANSDRRMTDFLSAFWRSVGARTITMSAREHDSLVAATSHLPHILAALLVKHVTGHGERVASLCGGGFRDTTRLADGSPEMWHDVIVTNTPAVRRELTRFRNQLDECLKMIDQENFSGIRRLLEQARDQRRRLMAAQSAS